MNRFGVVRRVALTFLVIVTAWGSGPAASIQTPSMPVGVIAGKITSALDGMPLAGIRVAVIEAGEKSAVERSTTTSADGLFALKDLPAGSNHRLRFSGDGFVPRFQNVSLLSSAGQFPQGNATADLDVIMAPATGTIAGKIFSRDGRVAQGVTVGVDLRSSDYQFVTQVVSGADGAYQIAGLPASPAGILVRTVVQPFDENQDGQADYESMTVTVFSYPSITTRSDIVLGQSAGDLLLVTSDIEDRQHSIHGAINFLYSRPIDLDRTEATLVDNTTGKRVATTLSLDTEKTKLQIAPSGPSLINGRSYSIMVNATALNGAVTSDETLFKAVDESSGLLAAVTGLTVLTDPIDETTTSFALKWDSVAMSVGYRIFAKDNRTNVTWVEIATAVAVASPTVTATLSTTFDTFSGDGKATPFAFGTSVIFAVVPVNSAGKWPDPSLATAVTKFDNKAPTASFGFQDSTANNAGGTSEKKVTLPISFSEYMDKTTLPTLTAATGVTVSFELNANLTQGIVTLTVPAGVNGTGTLNFGGAKDSSGNVVAPIAQPVN